MFENYTIIFIPSLTKNFAKQKNKIKTTTTTHANICVYYKNTSEFASSSLHCFAYNFAQTSNSQICTKRTRNFYLFVVVVSWLIRSFFVLLYL